MDDDDRNLTELRAIAAAIRALEARAKRAGAATTAYLLDMAAQDAEARTRGN